ncbi:MAG: translocation/assembly module TamB domain-containing protein [Paracoccus sp. (in: a-proteobacteria)]|nr:translocation/assembly module TamB domain-containing protein [Paracoccus sp. (in: a-proteobacteria)]
MRKLILALGFLLLLPAFLVAQQAEPRSAAEISAEEESDVGFLTRFLQTRLSASGREVRIVGFRGALSSRATFEQITIADDDGIWMTLHDGAIQWNRSRLFAGVVDVAELSARLIEIPRAPIGEEDAGPTPEARPFALPELPVGINIGEIDAERVELGPDIIGEPVAITIQGELNLTGGDGDADVTIQRVDGKQGSFQFEGSFSNETRMLKIDLQLDEAENGLFANLIGLHGRPSVNAHIIGEGPLSDFAADIELATAGQPRITGTVSVAQAPAPDDSGSMGSSFAIDIGGDVGGLLPEDGEAFFGNNARLAAQGWLSESGRLLVPTLAIDTNVLKLSGELSTNADGAPVFAALDVLFGAEAGVPEDALPVRIPALEPATKVRSGKLALNYNAAESSAWSLDGWLAEIERPDMRLAALDLTGQGHVTLDGNDLDSIDGAIRFAANALDFTNPGLAEAVGDNLGGSTNFEFVPGQVVHLTGLNIGGDVFSLGGEATVDGLSSGIVLSGNLTAAHRDLSTLSTIAGRDLSGRADAEINGYWQYLSNIFDADVDLTGTDITVDQPQADRLLEGASTVEISVRRDEDGLDLRHLAVNAQRISLTGAGQIATDSSDVTAMFEVPGLEDLDDSFGGSIIAVARMTGPDGARRLSVTGNASDLQTGIREIDGGFAGETELAAVLAQVEDGGFQIEELRLTNPQISLQGEGQLAADDLNADIVLNIPELARFGRDFGGALNAKATLVSEPDGARRLSITGTGQDLAFGEALADGMLTGLTQIDIQGVERGGDIEIDRAHIVNRHAEITASGVIAETGTDARADLRITDLAVLGLGWSGSAEAEATLLDAGAGERAFTLDGTVQNFALGQTEMDRAFAGETRVIARGTERSGVVTLDVARISNDLMNAEAQGVVGPRQIDLDATINASDLSFLGRGIAGAVEAEGRITQEGERRSVDLSGHSQDLRIGIAQADAALRGRTVFTIRGEQDETGFRIDGARIENPQVFAEAQGTYGDQGTDLNARVRSPDISFLGGGFSGALDLTGTLADQAGVRRFDVSGTGTNLALGQTQADGALAGQTQIAATGTEQGGVFNIESAQITNPRLNISGSGTVGPGVTDVSGRVAASDLSFIGGGLRGAVDANIRFADAPGGIQRIEASGTANNLAVGNTQADRLLAGQTRFDTVALLDGGQVNIQRLDARNPQAQIIASGDPRQAVELDARLTNLDLLVPGLTGPAQVIGTIQQQDGAYGLNLAATAPGGTRAQISGSAQSDFSSADIQVSGVSNAAILNPLIRTRSVEGPVSFDLRLAGPPELDSLTGTIRLTDVSVAEPRLGMRLQGVNLTAQLDRGLIQLDGGGQMAAGGAISVSGPINLRGQPSLDVAIRLNDLVVRDPALYEARLNGVLTASGVLAEGALISGTINVAEAELRIPSTGLGGARQIPEIIHRRDSWQVRTTRARAGLEPFGSLAAQQANLGGPAATPPAVPLRLNINIEAPNQIFVRGRGVDAELGGSVRLTGTARDMVPIGFFELIRGRLDLLGRRFDLSEGLIELQGDFRPLIRLVATNVQSDITTMIIIDGELMEPDIRFESTPELPEEEVLSHLLFGRGLENITALQAAQLANAIAVLAGQGGAGIVDTLRDSIGLDDLDLTTDDEGNVAVRAGRYLSRNVYTDVEIGGDGESRVNLNLDITPNLTARGSVGTDGNSRLGIYFDRDY